MEKRDIHAGKENPTIHHASKLAKACEKDKEDSPLSEKSGFKKRVGGKT